MTVAVVFHATQAENFVQQWEFALSNFKANALYCYGGTPPRSNVLSKAQEITSAADLPEHPLVLLSPREAVNVPGETSLSDFTHPEDVTYWFGSDAAHLTGSPFTERQPDSRVFVPTDTTDNMYSFAAYLVTAWDRRCKG